MIKVNGFAAHEPKGRLQKFQYELPEIGLEEVDIKVAYCGLCHSDLSMLNNDWDMTQFPFVPGHEIVGEVVNAGSRVKGIKVGDKVGLSWFSQSCMHCEQCMSGSQQLCASSEQTLVGRHGGFADTVRGHWSWVISLPGNMDLAKAGPLLCAGMTVFHPIILENVRAIDKVGVIGIGGLGHLAIKFLKHWGCEVVAFSSNKSKHDEIKSMGASRVVDSTNIEELQTVSGQLNFILNTAHVSLDWDTYISCLAPKGKLHTVGIIPEPMSIPSFSLINGQKSVAGSPGGGPALIKTMLDFCVRHNIYPITEEFAIENVNEAIKHLEDGKARYRIVLKV
ncbi:NAD(P)-dependent alcohol dehydrogenase [Dyadobacter chenwenxiniae]|uniref:alcohol dehydrogenase (NADP(+)) n=1 Tax=Dyadobacter chenwenxiniae TaxID=2906456 RepID=A0A9X1PPK6_9BACT|nr:NAD(P)-dependent alcohol dehydrogenase [Dyadobacter chenwenxiniae]MCF0065117.1 NAD(P)-dependent alcohol dehydrogenase [Dyadobacter chenwenxiniae]UON84611.1 NAD(P)-dependent alcohol dehydrogenase [Dyadobacter chenwenxiniae]